MSLKNIYVKILSVAQILIKRIILFSFTFVMISCGETNQNTERPAGDAEIYDKLLKINRYIVKRNHELVENFVRRTGWDMKRTDTGLWYEIIEKTDGKVAEEGLQATINFNIELLDGTKITENSVKQVFTIGQGRVEAGIEEGIRFMKQGEKARFILPPHLAHGNFGDNRKAPSGSVLIYEVKLLDIR
jgi:FKBP-type peptidyl-prolyl cis-trans isomerase